MPRIVVVLFVLVSASPLAAQEKKQPTKTKAIDLLFPLYKVTLGQTTVAELAKLGKAERELTIVKNFDFWHENGVAHHLYLTRPRMPCPWEQQGFDFELSYVGWLKLFENRGWQVKVVEAPKVIKDNCKETLQAKLEVTSGDIQLRLNFRFGADGATTAAPNTLYSLEVTWIGKK
jgi:hypothetical protein